MGYFNPRTPCGVRPDSSPVTSAPIKFQSTHPVRGATRCAYDLHAQRVISIHAPRAGCDTIFGGGTWEQIISIHAPRAGCDFIVPVDFMSFRISIHAPRAGCDADSSPVTSAPIKFQSTHPVRGATTGDGVVVTKNEISIHAPRAGCDVHDHQCTHHVHDFNPRTPCGVRL